MPLQYAAHVDHPISHHSEDLQLTVAAIGILATITIIATGGTAGMVLIASTATGIGIDVAEKADEALPVDEGAGKIATGFPKVLLGNSIKPAARADAFDTKSAICHEAKMFQGSRIVLLGPGVKPMTRAGDQVDKPCGGTVSDGVRTIMVGGVPSHEGEAVPEGDTELLHGAKMLNDAIGGTATVAKGAVMQGGTQLAAVLASAMGNEDASNLIKMMSIRSPETALDTADTANTAYKGVGAAVKILSGTGD